MISPEEMRRSLAAREAGARELREVLGRLPFSERDSWWDRVLGIGELPDDGPDLPRGCVPYLPCPVDVLLQMVDAAGVDGADVFVDVGSGLGRAAALTYFLTGAATIGVEVQGHLVRTARAIAAGLKVSPASVIHGDAAELVGFLPTSTVFFLYCPFSGARLERVLDSLEAIAATRQIRVCCVHLPLPSRPWLTLVSSPCEELEVYRSTLVNVRSSRVAVARAPSPAHAATTT